MMLIIAQEKVGRGASWIDLDVLLSPLLENGISQEECDEALDHLLMTSQIHEIDDDCFIHDEWTWAPMDSLLRFNIYRMRNDLSWA